MADNVPITAGRGPPSAADGCAGVWCPRVKLGDGTLDSTTPIPGDANWLRVSQGAALWPAGVILQNAATATGVGTAMDVRGYASALLVTNNASWTANVYAEASVDDVNWVALDFTALVQAAPDMLSAIINNGQTAFYRVMVAGYKSLRARITNYTSGSVTVTGYLGNTPSDYTNVWVRYMPTTSMNVIPTKSTTDVTASGTISAQNSNPNIGTPTANSTVALANGSFAGMATVSIQFTGTWNGNLQAQGTIDGTNWVNLSLITYQGGQISLIPGVVAGIYSCDLAGLYGFRISANSSGTGSSAFTLRASVASNLISLGVVGSIASPITLQSGLGYPIRFEDDASADGNPGMAILAVRHATPANTSGTDLDYELLQVNNGRLWVSGDNTGLVSTNNSSATPLGSGAVFTGTADDLTDYAAVTVYVFSNIVSATDGLSIQQSSDGTNWDHLDLYTVPASTGKSFHIQAVAKFVRVVYTNSGSAQGSFRLQTVLHKNAPRGSSVRPQDARPNDNDMEETLAYQMVFNGTTWDRVRGSVANGMAVDVTRLPAITKGTQGTTGVTTQDLKDAGRTSVRYYATNVAAGTTGTETIFTLTSSRGTAATTTGTSFTPASGKTFRIQYIVFTSRGNATAVAQVTTHSLRINTAGAAIVTSTPLVLQARTATPATSSAWDRVQIDIPDGYEIPGDGTLSFCVTANSVYVTSAPTWDVLIVGYEY